MGTGTRSLLSASPMRADKVQPRVRTRMRCVREGGTVRGMVHARSAGDDEPPRPQPASGSDSIEVNARGQLLAPVAARIDRNALHAGRRVGQAHEQADATTGEVEELHLDRPGLDGPEAERRAGPERAWHEHGPEERWLRGADSGRWHGDGDLRAARSRGAIARGEGDGVAAGLARLWRPVRLAGRVAGARRKRATGWQAARGHGGER